MNTHTRVNELYVFTAFSLRDTAKQEPLPEHDLPLAIATVCSTYYPRAIAACSNASFTFSVVQLRVKGF
jgi:hypothetical protein